MQRTRSMILSGVLAMLLVAWLPAVAQSQSQNQPQNQPQAEPMAPAESFSQQEIEAFADAALEVGRVKTDFDAQTQGVDNPDELARLHQDAEAAAIQAVEESGLSPDQYSAIIEAANQDPQLYAMIVDLMQQRSTQ